VNFYLSPYDAKVAKVFKGAPGLFTKRMPISGRAGLSYKKVEVPDIDWKLCRKNSFRIGSSNLTFINKSRYVEAHIIPAVISHFVPIFENKNIQVSIRDVERNIPYFSIKAFKIASISDKRHFLWDPGKFPLASLEFYVFSNRIHLNTLGSPYNGFGGKMITALYNIAKDIGFCKITFDLNPKNKNAYQFYFHMDFGRFVEEMDRWEVDVN